MRQVSSCRNKRNCAQHGGEPGEGVENAGGGYQGRLTAVPLRQNASVECAPGPMKLHSGNFRELRQG